MAILARRSASSLETLLAAPVAPGGGPRAASSAYPLFPSLSLPRTPADTVDGPTRKARHTTPFSTKPGGSSIQDAAARPMAPEAPRRPYARRAGPGQPQGASRVVLSGSLLAGRSSSGDSIVEDEGLLAAIRAVSTGEAGVPEAHSRQRLPCIATAGFTSAVGVAAPLFRLGQRALSQDNR